MTEPLLAKRKVRVMTLTNKIKYLEVVSKEDESWKLAEKRLIKVISVFQKCWSAKDDLGEKMEEG